MAADAENSSVTVRDSASISESEHRTQDVQHGTTGRRPRRACHRIQDRCPTRAASEAAKEFREAALIHFQRGIEEAVEYRLNAVAVPISRKASGDHRVVVRPNRAIVVRHRIIARFRRSDGSDAPAGKRISAKPFAR